MKKHLTSVSSNPAHRSGALASLRNEFNTLKPPVLLWWRIRFELGFQGFEAVAFKPSRPKPFASLSAACAVALIWLVASDSLLHTRLPVTSAVLAARPVVLAKLKPPSGADDRHSGQTAVALGAESLALLGMPFIETSPAQTGVSASRHAQWVTDTSGQILALRLPN